MTMPPVVGTDASNTFEDLSGIIFNRAQKPVLGTCNGCAPRGVSGSGYESTSASRPVSPWSHRSHSTEESDTDHDMDDNPYDLLIEACGSDPVCPLTPSSTAISKYPFPEKEGPRE